MGARERRRWAQIETEAPAPPARPAAALTARRYTMQQLAI